MTGEDFIPAMRLVRAQLAGAGADRAVLDEVGDMIELAASTADNLLALAGLVVAGEARLSVDSSDLVGIGALLAAGAYARHVLETAEVTP